MIPSKEPRRLKFQPALSRVDKFPFYLIFLTPKHTHGHHVNVSLPFPPAKSSRKANKPLILFPLEGGRCSYWISSRGPSRSSSKVKDPPSTLSCLPSSVRIKAMRGVGGMRGNPLKWATKESGWSTGLLLGGLVMVRVMPL